MSSKNHIVLENSAETVEFVSSGHGNPVRIERNAVEHIHSLREAYSRSVAAFANQTRNLPEGVDAVDGTYLSLKVNKKAGVEPSLDTKSGARLMNVKSAEADEEEDIVAFIPSDNAGWFGRKAAQYEVEPAEGNRRRNEPLINAISSIDTVELKDFFSSEKEFEAMEYGRTRDVEVWFADDLFEQDDVCSKLRLLGIEFGHKTLVFTQVVILLVRADARQLEQIIHCLTGITEFRLHRWPSVLTQNKTIEEDIEWAELIKREIQAADGELSRIAILDSGVANGHTLIRDFLPDGRCHSVTAIGNKEDRWNHGTGLASLALYGDLTDAIYDAGPLTVMSDLSSVKMLPGPGEQPNDKELYAVITEDAIVTGRSDGAEILCSAVTDKDSECIDGAASSTSAAIDETLYNDGACDSLLLVSAGNIGTRNGVDYPDYLYTNSIEDPAQSWNAVTVGAYTRKVAVADPRVGNVDVIAPEGGMSPFSRTSVQWGKHTIKPEILMEGGNAYELGNGLGILDDLSLVAADADFQNQQFTCFNATSAATALAARLAGRIKYFNPGLSPLSVRALMIHSAEWTDAMKSLCVGDNGDTDYKLLVHTCGYGVPDEKVAIASSDSRVTFIAEDVLYPFVEGSNDSIKFGKMNLYRMPWPKDVLLNLGQTDVKLKITLSYYVKPSPGIRSRLNKYTYQSIRLKFDVNGPQESCDEFERRIKKEKEGEEDARRGQLSGRWKIGINTRNQGSIISDSIEMTAAELAGCEYIAVFPSGGWFKNKKENLDLGVRYSLVVSIEAPEQEIYNAVAQQIGIAQPVEVPVEG